MIPTAPQQPATILATHAATAAAARTIVADATVSTSMRLGAVATVATQRALLGYRVTYAGVATLWSFGLGYDGRPLAMGRAS